LLSDFYRWAEYKLGLGKAATTGSTRTLADSVAAYHARTGKLPPGHKEAPEPCAELLYLWTLFCEVAKGDDLTCTELAAWMQLTGHRLVAWEVEVLLGLDGLRRKAAINGNGTP
jgi:hypothetical protein